MTSGFGRAAFRAACALALFASVPAFAQFKGVGVATGSSVVMGDRYRTFQRATVFQADLYQVFPSAQDFALLRYSVDYRNFAVQGLNVDAKYRNLAGWAGGQFQTTMGPLGITPYFGLQLGLIYESLSFPDASSTSNSATKFGTRILPGFDWAFGSSGVGAYFETPFEVMFVKNALTVWNVLAGVRFKL